MLSRLTWLSALLTLPFASSVLLATRAASPQPPSPDLYSALKWRNIGPFHGGRISGVSGAIGQPGVFYAATPQGGIWKTTSAGVTWLPIADQLNIDSFGAVQVAPSDPNIVYVGSGDPFSDSNGDGMYKSTDAGRTWTHTGLDDTTKIPKILINPKNPDLVLACALGNATHHGGGVYRSTDGGRTWQNVLKPEGVLGVRDLEYAFDMPNVMFATTQVANTFGGGYLPEAGRGATPVTYAKLFKSTDEGRTWSEITTLPHYPGRISVAVAMHTNGQRVYVVGSAIDNGSGLYRSDDGGATWTHMAGSDTRISNGQGTFSSGVWVDPQNPDLVYVVSIPLYRSTDGGHTFTSFKGAPGGEDYHVLWIDPTNGQRIAVGSDQGATATLDGGHTWSLWYNQPIAQVYHVATDTQYPYWVMAAQQDTGAVMTRSRGDFGQINFTDWLPLPSSEVGTITADPLNPEILYGVGFGPAGGGSGIVKINMRTGQWQNMAPNFGADAQKFRQTEDFWKRFDIAFEPSAMYVGYQCLLVTRDGAQTWKIFSPDLTTTKDQKQVACGEPPPAPAQPSPGGGSGGDGEGETILDFFLSAAQKGAVWTLSTNGQIYNTIDGGQHWTNVSNISDVPPGIRFQAIDGAHHDVMTAYVTGWIYGGPGGAPQGVDINVPLIWRTHDGGKTWTKIVSGLPSDEPTGSWVNVVREDPMQKGLLFCGTGTTVYVSFDDGDHWQSLRLNLPNTDIRDLVFHTHDHMNDIVIGTYGRGFWVLDDMSPLREIAVRAQEIAAAPAFFFKPGDAIRARKNVNWDQPTSVEEPHAPNPPYGAILYYRLGKPATGEVTLQVFDAAGHLVRTMSSIPPPPVEGAVYPDYWLATPESRSLSASAGSHRTNWDLQYDDPPAFTHNIALQVNMVEASVTPGPHGPQVPPGTYTLKLTVGGQVYTQTVVVHNDPRVGESPAILAALKAQHAWTLLAYQAMKDTFSANEEVAAARAQVSALLQGQPPADIASRAKDLDTRLATFGGAVEGRGGGRGGGGGGGGAGGGGNRAGQATPDAKLSFIQLNDSFNTIVSIMQVGLDVPPTQAQIDTWETNCRNYTRTLTAWKAMLSEDLPAFNAELGKNKLKTLTAAPTRLTAPGCTFAPPAQETSPRR